MAEKSCARSPATDKFEEGVQIRIRGGAPEEIRTPDPQIRSLVLYPAELRARRAVAIAFDRRRQGGLIAGRQRLKRRISAMPAVAAVAAVVSAGTDRRPTILPVFGLDAQSLAECEDEKSNDKDCAEHSDNSRQIHLRHCRAP
jgi:hypothetical protein